LEVLYLDISYVNVHTHMLQTYVVNISSVSDVYCNKCFMLQVFHKQARQERAGKGGSLGRSSPRVHTGIEAGAEHKAIFMGVAASAEHEVALMDRQQVRSTKLQSWAGSRRGG
jgi:hypothetical protein